MYDNTEELVDPGHWESELQRARGALQRLLQGVRAQAASLRRLWREAVDDVLRESARLAEGLAGTDGSGGDLWRGLGLLAGLAGRAGTGPAVEYTHPTVPRPDGALLPGALAAMTERQAASVGVVVSPGAVQITAQQVDEQTLARAADTLAHEIQARLAFEDRRLGRG